MGKRLERFFVWFVGIIFGAIAAYLFGMSIRYTCFVNSSEVTYYIADTPLLQIGCILVFIGVLTCIRKKWNADILEKIFPVYTGAVIVFAVLFVFATQYAPIADQEHVMNCAQQLLQGNFSPWEQGGYLYTYSYQTGFVLLLALFSLLFGGYNYVAFQFLNIAALVVCFYFVYQICLRIFERKNLSKLIIMAMFSFIPFVLYVTFVYGTILGLTGSVIAVYLEFRYFETGKLRQALLGAVVMTIAVLIKLNYMIFFAAYGIMLFVDFLIQQRKKSLLALVILLMIYFAGDYMVTAVTEMVTGMDMPEGTPMIASVAMGLQEGYLAPGWNNDYDAVSYRDTGYDASSVDYFSRIHIKNSLLKFREDTEFANSFFARKIASQWINPTFECFWLQNGRTHSTQDAWWVTSLTDTGGLLNKVSLRLLNVMQSILYFGVCLYVLLCLKKADIRQLIFAIIMIGGFLFYIVWEGKCQYTIPYFVLIIPYAVKGYDVLTKYLAEFHFDRNWTGFRFHSSFVIAVMGIIMAWYGIHMMSYVKSGDELYYVYNVQASIQNRFGRGEYYIAAHDNTGYVVTAQVGDTQTTAYLDENAGLDNQKLSLCSYEDQYLLWYAHSHQYLSVLDKLSDYTFVTQTAYSESEDLRWIIQKNTSGEGFFVKTATELYLQYDLETGMITVGRYTGESSQLWDITAAE